MSNKLVLRLSNEIGNQMFMYASSLGISKKVEKSREKLSSIFKKLIAQKKKIIGYGATAKVNTILNYCKIKNETLEYFLDTTPNKTGKFMPGSHLYIQKYHKSSTNKVDYIFLGAWNFKEEIFKKEKKFIKRGGKFIIHTPMPKII